MTTLFPARPRPIVPVAGTDASFPIGRIFCVGRNYAAHAREMGSDPNAEPPFFFAKDADAHVPNGSTIAYPQATHDFHYECELVVAIGAAGFNLAADQTDAVIFGYAVGLDMTRRDLQADAKSHGRPWSTAKNFPHSAPMGTIHPVVQTGLLRSGPITLKVNGATRQSADIADMIWNVADVIAALSKYYRLAPGDLIYTGTPEGVGPVQPGDVLDAAIGTLDPLRVRIGPPEGGGTE